jgi:hypothetical protein
VNTNELDHLSWYVEYAESLESRIKELETERITTHITGMPQGYGISNKTQDTAIQIADLKTELEFQYKKCADKLTELTKFIGEIQDPEIKCIFTYRFIECRTYGDIAKKKNYYDHTVVWKKVNNYLSGVESKQKQNRSE